MVDQAAEPAVGVPPVHQVHHCKPRNRGQHLVWILQASENGSEGGAYCIRQSSRPAPRPDSSSQTVSAAAPKPNGDAEEAAAHPGAVDVRQRAGLLRRGDDIIVRRTAPVLRDGLAVLQPIWNDGDALQVSERRHARSRKYRSHRTTSRAVEIDAQNNEPGRCVDPVGAVQEMTALASAVGLETNRARAKDASAVTRRKHLHARRSGQRPKRGQRGWGPTHCGFHR